MPRVYPSPEQRIYNKTDRSGECWIWQATVNRNGYAMMFIEGKMRSVHRWSYEHFIGPIPEGLQLDHLCHTNDPSCSAGDACLHRRCVNPHHLQPVTCQENTLRGKSFAAEQARRTHCPQGHPYTPDNLYDVPSSAGVRRCLACRKAYIDIARERRIQRRLTPRT